MANKNYTLSDILGAPISKQEALTLIKQNTDSDTFRAFNLMDDAYREKLLRFIMGKNGLAITYDPVFKRVIMPGDTTDRLQDFISEIIGEQVEIKQLLPREGSQISEKGSFIIADIIVSLQNGSIINVEIQKIGYDFPGERCSCYTADMIMRQYNYLKNKNEKFTYKDMKPVYLIVFMEKSPAIFHETDQYMHQKHTLFDTGIKINLLDNITFISLDTFKSVVQNIDPKREAWLKFLTEDDPDEIVKFVNQYPEFLPCYHDLIAFRQNPKEMINMFSDALRELDRNTERYMVEELNKEVKSLKETISNLNAEIETIAAKRQAIIVENEAMAVEKEAMAVEKEVMAAEKEAMAAENEAMAKRITELEAQLHALNS